MRPALLLLALSLLLSAGVGPCEPPEILFLRGSGTTRVWERFESIGILRHAAANVFDPDQIALTGEFEAPDGERFEMPGFASRDYARTLVGGFEKLAPRSALYWAVRFIPVREGRWRWRWRVETPRGTTSSSWRTFTATRARPGRHGFLRVSPLDPRYLRFDDGTPFFALGENLSWYDGRGSFAYDDWLARLAAEGANYIRLWMPSWAFGIEWGEEGLGDYGGRLGRAWQLDYVLERAEAHGLYVMLCIQNHGPFSLDTNTQWADNPYNAANGGPLEEPGDFFTHPEALRLFERRLRYVVARWGYSPHILAWELWNEINAVADPRDPDVVAWHARMARVLDALDPYDHLISTSISSVGRGGPLFALPEMDFTQSHTYAYPFYEDTGSLLLQFADRERIEGKPHLIGEFGADFRGPGETLAADPAHIAFHDGLWIGVLGETFGTGMTWWWDNVIDPEDQYFHFGAVARFVEGVAFDEEGFVPGFPVVRAEGRRVVGYSLAGETTVLAWVKNFDHHYAPRRIPPGGSRGDPVPVEGATLTLPGVADGLWHARWIDTLSGEDLHAEAIVVADGVLRLDVPPFVGDVALRMERE